VAVTLAISGGVLVLLRVAAGRTGKSDETH